MGNAKHCTAFCGTIRIDSDTHKLYVGKACNVVSSAAKPECVIATDTVYLGYPEANTEEA